MRAFALLAIPFLALSISHCGGTDADADAAPLPESDGGVPPSPLQLSLEVEELAAGKSATGTVAIHDEAPDEGAEVALSASDPLLSLPPAIAIAPGDHKATFELTNTYAGTPKPVRITAVYGDASAVVDLFIPRLPPEPPVCRTHACTK